MTIQVELIIAGALVIIGLDLVLIWLHAVNQELLNTVKKYKQFVAEAKSFENDADGFLKEITQRSVSAVKSVVAFEELYKDMVELTNAQHNVMKEIYIKEKELGDKINLDVGSLDVSKLNEHEEEDTTDEKL